MPEDGLANRWLLLIHQLPPKPSNLRVRVWRRLQDLGAVPIKNSVYVLPNRPETREDFEWLRRELSQDGGEASICEARFVDGLRDDEVEALFNTAREADYRELAAAAQALVEVRSAGGKGRPDAAAVVADVARLRRRLGEVVARDFFGAPGRGALEGLLSRLEPEAARSSEAMHPDPTELRGRTWVTRKGVHIDRIATAWLVRRFVDADATFKFVAAKGYRPEAGEIRFDMFDAEFTHDGDRCTFEVVVERLALSDPALRGIGEIVHDIDLKDGKFGRPETAGIDHLVAGLCMAHARDEDRLARGGALFDDLYEYLRRKRA